MRKKTGSLFAAAAAAVLSLCLLAGATFALFAKQSQVDIAITSGDISVTARADGLVLYSAQADPEGDLSDGQGNTYSYARREDGTFVNGGTAHIEGGTLTIDRIAPGDVFFLPAGRVHAIGAGSFIAEIQQTSNITYRIYDYGRVGADGKPRELHTELAKEAIDYTVLPDYRTHYETAKDRPVELVSCPYFTTTLFDLTKEYTLDRTAKDSFLVVICIEGRGTLTDSEGNTVPVHQGETVLVPATATSLRFTPEENMKVLTSSID